MISPVFASVARYTRLVLMGKRALWVLTGLLTFIVFVVAWINSSDDAARIVLNTPHGATPPEAASMLRPRYQGVDAKDRPFTIVADEATQPEDNIVLLENLSADMMMNESAWLAVTAGRGRYETLTKMLYLSEQVNLFYEGGYEFRSQDAHVDINAGSAHGENPVEGQGPAGILKADSFKILDHGRVLRFNGNVYVTLYR